MTAAEITASADTFLRAHRFRGAVLLAREGAVLLREGYGFANEEWTIPNSPLTKFRIGSITKMFTAAAVLRLAEAGAINLHSEIGKSVEDLRRIPAGR